MFLKLSFKMGISTGCFDMIKVLVFNGFFSCFYIGLQKRSMYPGIIGNA